MPILACISVPPPGLELFVCLFTSPATIRFWPQATGIVLFFPPKIKLFIFIGQIVRMSLCGFQLWLKLCRIFLSYVYLLAFIKEKLAERYRTPMLWPTGALVLTLTHTDLQQFFQNFQQNCLTSSVASRGICIPANQIVWPCFLPVFTSLSPDIELAVYYATFIF